MFINMSITFPKLKSITFQEEGFYGTINQKTFLGLENIETLRIIDTNIHAIEEGSFQILPKMTGMVLRT